MGTCFSKPTVDETPSLGTRDVASQEPSSSQQESVANVGAQPPGSSRSPNADHSRTSAEHSRTAPKQIVTNHLPLRPLDSKVQGVISEDIKFRLLIVGKRGSGKSSLIKAVFKVDVTDTQGEGDINVEFRSEDNRYLVVHEFSAFESQAGDSQNLRTIWDFISYRTDPGSCPGCSPSERLHAVWICIPASEAIAGRLGEGVEEILGMKKTVPVILVLTKFDAVVSEVPFNIASGDVLQYERARARAHADYEESIQRRFGKDPMDVPAEIVSVKPTYADLIEKLVVTTDGFVLGSRRPSKEFGVPGEKSRVSAILLVWAAALRVCHRIPLQTSIEVGQSKYWCYLLSSVNFDGHTLKSCVNTIHIDLVEIWNLNDKTGCLSNDGFKAKISHLVRDLGGNDHVMSGPNRGRFADWVYGVYEGSEENVRCIMGYIIHLTVILDALFSTISGDLSQENVQLVIDQHVSGKKDQIHRKIRGFVTGTSDLGFSARKQDLILKRIIDLIQEYCVPDCHDISLNSFSFLLFITCTITKDDHMIIPSLLHCSRYPIVLSDALF